MARLVGGFSLGGGRAGVSARAPAAQRPAAPSPAKRAAAPVARPVPQMRATGVGGAAAKASPATDGWEEF